ncbi:hypothetical protein LTR17_017783 [Elasticomyces elasticus]|nr:hypothetical protein LTR17_017783 [Elasticomyces elasticus]
MLQNFASTVSPTDDQSGLAWTPSKQLRSKIVRALDKLRPSLHNDASVIILFNLAHLPDLNDPFTWRCGMVGSNDTTDNHPELMPVAFHWDTLHGLENDASLQWPALGKLKVEAKTILPLWCSRAFYDEDVAAYRRAREAGDLTSMRVPRHGNSFEGIVARMLRSESRTGWSGFVPQGIEISNAQIWIEAWHD